MLPSAVAAWKVSVPRRHRRRQRHRHRHRQRPRQRQFSSFLQMRRPPPATTTPPGRRVRVGCEIATLRRGRGLGIATGQRHAPPGSRSCAGSGVGARAQPRPTASKPVVSARHGGRVVVGALWREGPRTCTPCPLGTPRTLNSSTLPPSFTHDVACRDANLQFPQY